MKPKLRKKMPEYRPRPDTFYPAVPGIFETTPSRGDHLRLVDPDHEAGRSMSQDAWDEFARQPIEHKLDMELIAPVRKKRLKRKTA